VDPIEVLRVSEVMDKNTLTIPSTMRVAELSDRIAAGDPELNRRQGTLIVDEAGNLAGIITRGDLLRALEANHLPERTVIDAGSKNLIVTYPDEVLRDAVAKMLRNDIGRLPVVARDQPRKALGYLGRSGVIAARMRSHDEEYVRERGTGLKFRMANPRPAK
jgi:CBS domain-containing protein